MTTELKLAKSIFAVPSKVVILATCTKIQHACNCSVSQYIVTNKHEH